jgi:Spy/CpxP family protein refolding chaperone
MRPVFTRAILVCAVVLAAAGAAHGQTTPAAAPSKVDAARQAALTDKRGLVERNMQLTPEEAKKFWPLYDAYQTELDKIVKRQNRAVIDYVAQESTMTDANAKRIAKEVIESDADEQKLREKTLKKMLGVIPARKAVRYFQIENKLRTFTRNDMAEQIPLVK